MRKFSTLIASLALSAMLMLGTLLPAHSQQAINWTLGHDSSANNDFSTGTAFSASGYTTPISNIFSLAGNNVVGTPAGTGTDAQKDFLISPSAAALSEKVAITVPANGYGGVSALVAGVVVRFQVGGTYANSHYLVSAIQGTAGSGTLKLYKQISTSGTFVQTQLQSVAFAVDYTGANHAAILTVAATGSNPTTINAVLVDALTGQTITQAVWTDSETTLQAAGKVGIDIYGAASQNYVTRIVDYYSAALPAASQVIWRGDSTVYGSYATVGGGTTGGTTPPAFLATILGPGWTTTNLGVPGQKVHSANGDEVTMATTDYTVTSLLSSSYVNNVIILEGGINDIGNSTDSAATIYNNMVALVGVYKAATPKPVVVVETIPHCKYSAGYPRGGSEAVFDPVADAVNALVRANWRSFCDGVVDTAGDSLLNDPTNTILRNADMIHYTDYGNARRGLLAANGVLAGITGGMVSPLDAQIQADTAAALTAQGYTAGVATGLAATNTRVALSLPNVAAGAAGGLPTGLTGGAVQIGGQAVTLAAGQAQNIVNTLYASKPDPAGQAFQYLFLDIFANNVGSYGVTYPSSTSQVNSFLYYNSALTYNAQGKVIGRAFTPGSVPAAITPTNP